MINTEIKENYYKFCWTDPYDSPRTSDMVQFIHK